MRRIPSPTQRSVAILVLLAVLLGIVWSASLVRTVQSLRGHLQEATVLADAPADVAPDTACAVVTAVHHDTRRLTWQTKGVIWLAPAFGRLPEIGGDLRSAPHLLRMADNMSRAGALACDAMSPILSVFGTDDVGDDGDVSPTQLVASLSQNRADLEQALSATEQARASWEKVDPTTLSPRLRGPASRVGALLPTIQSGLELAIAAPTLLGADELRSYLILAQNNDELRATGGFITAAGLVTVDAGRIEVEFSDSYEIDDFSKPYPEPPEPLQTYMLADLWVFRDSNWSPDFPSAAQQAADLYMLGTGDTPDGVIAIDMQALRLLIGALEPLHIPDTAEPVMGNNAIEWIRLARGGRATNEDVGEWYQTRKDFMGPFATAVKTRIERGDVDWQELVLALRQGLREKHILVYLDEPQVGDVLARRGWDGRISTTDGDYLYVVDSNLGFNKADPLIDRAIAYNVDLDTDEPVHSELTLTYHNRSKATDAECNPAPHYGNTYGEEMQRCYWDYLRVYVPEGARLNAATPAPLPAESLYNQKRGGAGENTLQIGPPEFGKQVFGLYFLVPRGETRTQQFRYDLPADIVSRNGTTRSYSLVVQKQPGSGPRPVTVTIDLPAGARPVTTMPAPTEQRGSQLIYTWPLNQDRTLHVTYNITR